MQGVEHALRYLGRWQNPTARRLAHHLAEAQAAGDIPEELRISLADVKEQMPVSPVLEENSAIIRLVIGGSPDVILRACEVGAERRPALLLYLDNMVKKEYVMMALDALVIHLRHEPLPVEPSELVTYLERRGLPNASITPHQTLGGAVETALSGDTILLVDGMSLALGMASRGWEHRLPEEPVSEPVVRGPKEGFTETVAVNLALVRRRMKDPRLRVERLQVGSRTRTDLYIVYVAGLATPELVTEVRARISRIQIDGILESGYVEEFIEDQAFTPFPLVKTTERPDVVTAAILEGRVGLLIDGTPHALILPTTFAGEMEAAEDYYQRWPMATFVRLLRYTYLLIALLGPSAYIAVTTFHQEMLPTSLLLSLMSAREGVPFPALVEALMMEFTLEALREAGLRLPKPVGQAISIVGALVIGEASVKAGLVSPVMVIVVSVTAISSFIIPIYSLAISIRLLRFVMMLLAGTLGFYGIVIGLIFLSIHLAGLRSFGVPYMSPTMPPNVKDMKDLMIRVPWWMMRRRPQSVPTGDRMRQPRGKRRPTPPSV